MPKRIKKIVLETVCFVSSTIKKIYLCITNTSSFHINTNKIGVIFNEQTVQVNIK